MDQSLLFIMYKKQAHLVRKNLQAQILTKLAIAKSYLLHMKPYNVVASTNLSQEFLIVNKTLGNGHFWA